MRFPSKRPHLIAVCRLESMNIMSYVFLLSFSVREK